MRTYRVGEFARLSGVSIRTLHHYDRIGLLRPSGRSEAGYRLYAAEDLLRLQQILTLRYLGFRLGQIRELLGRPDFDLVASLGIQRRALRDRIAELERVEQALARLLERRLASGQWAWELVAAASATVQQGLSKKGAEMDTYYTPEQMKQFEEAGRRISPEERRAVEGGWTALLADLHAQPDLDPASPAAKELLERWDRLTAATMRGFERFPELVEAIGENYRQGRFVGVEGAPQPADFAFIERARQAWGQGGGG